MKPVKTTFMLAIIVSVLGCVIWLVEFHDPRAKKTSQEEKHLLSFSPDTVTRLVFRNNDEIVEMEYHNEEWIIVKPVNARADFSAVNKLIHALEILPKHEVITSEERALRSLKLEDYGLDNPKTEISIHSAEGVMTLHVGRVAPLGNFLYARKPPCDEVTAISTNLLSAIPSGLNDIRDRTLMKNELPYVRRIEIRRSGRPTIQLTKKGAEWFIESPVFARAEWEKVYEMLVALFNIEIKNFVSETAADSVVYGLREDEAPLQIATWVLHDENARRIFFGKTLEDNAQLTYARTRDSQSVYAIDSRIIGRLEVGLSHLRSKTLYFMPADQVRKIRIGSPERVLELSRDDTNNWFISLPMQYRADQEQTRQLVNSLNSLPVSAFVEGDTGMTASGIFENPLYYVRMEGGLSQDTAEETAIVTRTISRHLAVANPEYTENKLMAKFSESGTLYELPETVTNIFLTDPVLYRHRTVLNIDPDTVVRVSIDVSGMKQTADLNQNDGKWIMTDPAAAAPDEDAIQRILSTVNNLQAQRFLPFRENDLHYYGLHQPGAVLTIGLKGEQGIQRSLFFGDISADLGVYTAIQGQDTVFVLDKETTETLTGGFIR